MTESILAGESLGKSFGRREVLRSASLWARRGQVTALVGRNGSGKTTLMQMCAGWLAPDHGTVRFRGELVDRPQLHELAHLGLMYLCQGKTITPFLTVRAHLEAVDRAFPGGDWEDAVETLDLGSFLDRRSVTLSGGEQKRVGLALALIRRPTCLLVDEPFSGLMPLDQERVVELLRRMKREGMAIVLSGHDVNTILDVADELVWVTSGSTRVLGSTAEALAHSQFVREYLGR